MNGEHDVTIALEDAKFEYTIHNVYLSFYTIFFNNFGKSDKPESPGWAAKELCLLLRTHWVLWGNWSIYLVEKVTELGVESIDDPNLPVWATKELCLLPGAHWVFWGE